MNSVTLKQQQELALFKKNTLKALTDMREDIQSLLFDQPRPQRDSLVQRTHFINGLIVEIRDDLQHPDDVPKVIEQLAAKYPLAEESVTDVKQYLGLNAATRPTPD